jgi:protein-S-isoprenylcysteine O-methyltransferase Ste14
MTELDTPVANNRPSPSRLIHEIVDDAGRLAGQQVDLFKAEVRDAAGKLSASAKLVAAGGVLAAAGVICLVVGLVFLLNYLVPSLPLWACWLIFATGLIVVGGAILYAGVATVTRMTPPPKQSLAALRENVSWIANRRTS